LSNAREGRATDRVRGAPGAMLIVISGPSGVGKDTILRDLKQRNSTPPRQYVVTYKTRARRANEVEGVDYNFVSDARFRELQRSGQLLEASQVHGHWSGTPRDQVVDALTNGRDAVLKIDVQGAAKIRERAPGALLIFIAPPSFDALVGRLKGRATETSAELDRREKDARVEIAHQVDYDHVVVNETDRANRTADRIDEIIASEHRRHPERQVAV
jgi:guanylate kinase